MKIKISLWWYFFLLMATLSNSLKTFIIIFIMLSIHEMAHVLCAIYFHYEVSTIKILPFGLGAVIEHIDHGSSIEEILILAAGLSTHLFYPFIFELMYDLGFISKLYCTYLIHINMSILFFNLLPIYPLDGGRLLDAFFHLFFTYRHARLMTSFFSAVFLFIVIYLRWLSGISAMLVVVFLGIEIITGFHERAYDSLNFYYYRYLHPSRQRVKTTYCNDLYRNYQSILLNSVPICDERKWLSKQFETPKYFFENTGRIML